MPPAICQLTRIKRKMSHKAEEVMKSEQALQKLRGERRPLLRGADLHYHTLTILLRNVRLVPLMVYRVPTPDLIPLGFLPIRSMHLKMWSLHEQHQNHPGTC